MNKSAVELINPNNCVLALIDHQPQMFFGVQLTDRKAIIKNNVIGLEKKPMILS